jgi:hypothetical protein
MSEPIVRYRPKIRRLLDKWMEGLPDLAERPSNTYIARRVNASRQTITAYMSADSDDPLKWLKFYDEDINRRLVELFTDALGSVDLPDDRNGDENCMFQEKRLTLRPWIEETAPAALVAV